MEKTKYFAPECEEIQVALEGTIAESAPGMGADPEI